MNFSKMTLSYLEIFPNKYVCIKFMNMCVWFSVCISVSSNKCIFVRTIIHIFKYYMSKNVCMYVFICWHVNFQEAKSFSIRYSWL